MRIRGWIVILFLGLGACTGEVPGLDYLLHDGQRGSKDKLLGRWVVINYWADWCAPCVREMPELEDFARNHPGVVVWAHDFDRARGAALEAKRRRLAVAVPSLLTDPKQLWGWPHPQVLPVTFIVSPSGELDAVLTGPQTAATLAAAIGD